MLRVLLCVGVLVWAVPSSPCDNDLVRHKRFCDSSLTLEQRARALVSELTLEEKVLQTLNEAPAIPRLAIPAYQWWTESLHGILSQCTADGRCPTSFPMPIGLAASFNMTLVRDVAQAVSSEARRLFMDEAIRGLDFWAPNINIFRDPRWGRGKETPGEDPFLSGNYAVQYIRGMQEGKDSRFFKTIGTLKHFAGYSLERFHDMDRFKYDAKITRQDLHQTYFAAFKQGVEEGRAHSVMCSYNSVNGIPACASKELLEDYLRTRWKFDGYVVSDCDAIDIIFTGHKYASSKEEAAAIALEAGTDLDCGQYYRNLAPAIAKNLTQESVLDQALHRLFYARFRLGLFDSYDSQPEMNYPASIVNGPEHRELALQAAHESIVLLKNLDNTLPLSRQSGKIAVIGPHANSTEPLCGNYHGSLGHVVSVLEGILEHYPIDDVLYAQGSGVTTGSNDQVRKAIQAARSADQVILVLGIDDHVEAESKDRYDIGLPAAQLRLYQEVLQATQNVILVLVNGGSLDISDAKLNPRVKGILEAFYPGEQGGLAVADVLFGHYNPSGRLPITILDSDYINQVDFLDMSLRNGMGRTYRFYRGEPVYPFGFGLSYTEFHFKVVSSHIWMRRGEVRAALTVRVSNVGSMDGAVSVLSFISNPSPLCPLRQLFDMRKFSLARSESTDFVVEFSGAQAHCYTHSGRKVVVSGEYTVSVGEQVSFKFVQPNAVALE